MAATRPSLEDKVSFFRQLEALSRKSDDDEEFEEEEETRRRQFRAFHAATSKPPGPHAGQQRDSEQPLLAANIRRTASAPMPLTESKHVTVIERTPLAEIRKPRRKGPAPLDALTVEETPIPDSTRAPLRPLLRSATTPLPLTRQGFSENRDGSPSLVITMKMKKRKRDSLIKLVPDADQVFKGLAFFFIPNDDIAGARKLRIRKAQEYGARWTRELRDATHIIVDKQLSFKDITPVLGPADDDKSRILVNEEYPLDCVQFRSLLNPNQRHYQVPGCPAPSSAAKAPASSVESGHSIESLQLKPPTNDPKRWDYVPPAGTPPRSGESSQQSREKEGASAIKPIQLDLQPTSPLSNSIAASKDEQHARDTSNRPSHVEVPALSPKDDLSELIFINQQFKDLPLDKEDDEDTASVVDISEEVSDLDSGGSEDERQRRKKRVASKPSRPGQKQIAWEDRFACNKGGTVGGDTDNPNARTIEVLQSMCDYYERVNDSWRTNAYRKAISVLKRQPARITTEEEAFQLPNIGQRLAMKIAEIVTTDRLTRLEYAQKEPTDEALQLFLNIYDVGHAQANRWIAQGLRTLDDLKEKAKLTKNQRVGVEHFDDLNMRIPRREVEALAQVVRAAAAKLDPTVEFIVGGSYRRGSESSNDIDFIVTKNGTTSTAGLATFLRDLVSILETQEFLVARLASSMHNSDGSKWHGCCVLPKIKGFNDVEYRPIWRRIDFLLVPETEMGAALIYFTGNDIFNRSIRLLASKKGMRLNQRGLYKDVIRGPGRVKVTEGELVEGRDEKRIFEILGVKWREPHERWC